MMDRKEGGRQGVGLYARVQGRYAGTSGLRTDTVIAFVVLMVEVCKRRRVQIDKVQRLYQPKFRLSMTKREPLCLRSASRQAV
jgi:hypothetical protein